jgi:hypothetical protein
MHRPQIEICAIQPTVIAPYIMIGEKHISPAQKWMTDENPVF